MCRRGWTRCRNKIIEISKEKRKGNVCIGGARPPFPAEVLYCYCSRGGTFAVFKCEAMANSVTGYVCVNSNVILKNMELDRKIVFAIGSILFYSI